MPTVARPDGCELYWEERGEETPVVVANLHYSPPALLSGLVGDLAADHRVVTYHLRGTGSSSRVGPYDMETDAEDLRAVVEAAGPPAIAICLGDGCNRAVRVAAAHPDLISTVVIPGPPAFGTLPEEFRSDEALASSPPVLMALVRLMETDYRAALRTMMETGNPAIEDAGIRERVDAIVDYCPHEAAAARMRDWVGDDAWEPAATIGERLWLLTHGRNPWFGEALADMTNELLPKAHREPLADGPFERPDLTAAAVRRISSRL